jgi:hypothetical protein
VSAARIRRLHGLLTHTEEPDARKASVTMYDMYPDWGPATHDPDHPLHRDSHNDALQGAFNRTAGTALRDEDDPRPDDN